MSEIETATDLQLLVRYTRDRAEDAFTEVVRRHLGLVHSAALRQVRSPQLAEEVAQSVFADLARNAPRLVPSTILTAWLYQVTRRTAIDVVRREARRQLREQIATEMNTMNATTADWTHIEPLLDDAMSALDAADRATVLLRYFENKSLREVGATLGISDDAAQKRVGRAVERLREFFSKRGLRVGASGLIVVISANAVQAAPVGLAVTISTAAALAGTTFATSATATTINSIAVTTLQKTVITAALAAAVGTGIYEARQASNLRSQVQTLQQQQAPVAEQIQQLSKDRDDVTRQLSVLRDDNERLNRNTVELAKLRGEVGLLRQQRSRAPSAEEENAQLRAALANAQSTADRVTFNQQEQNIFNDMKQLVAGIRLHAREFNGFMPTNFEKFASELSVTTNFTGTALLLPNGNALSNFEFMNAGIVNDTMPDKLIFRERNLRRTPDGNWTRVYGLADGTVVKRISRHGNFDDWEKERMVQP